MSWDRIAGIGMPAWRDGEDLCALADGDRHLGHVINEGEWQAFDALRIISQSRNMKVHDIAEDV